MGGILPREGGNKDAGERCQVELWQTAKRKAVISEKDHFRKTLCSGGVPEKGRQLGTVHIIMNKAAHRIPMHAHLHATHSYAHRARARGWMHTPGASEQLASELALAEERASTEERSLQNSLPLKSNPSHW